MKRKGFLIMAAVVMVIIAGVVIGLWLARSLDAEQPVETSTVREPHMLYLFPASGIANIYSLDPQTGQVEQLTEFPLGILEYDVSDNGTELYFSARNAQAGSDIYRLPLANDPAVRQPELLLDCQASECRAPRISPRADYLAFERIDSTGDDTAGYVRVWFVTLPGNVAALGKPALAGDPLHQTYLPDWSS